MERSIIRHLYGRPLETLLATWGISLVLIQSVRLIFGAQNVELANPSYLSGGVEAFHGWFCPIVVLLYFFRDFCGDFRLDTTAKNLLGTSGSFGDTK